MSPQAQAYAVADWHGGQWELKGPKTSPTPHPAAHSSWIRHDASVPAQHDQEGASDPVKVTGLHVALNVARASQDDFVDVDRALRRRFGPERASSTSIVSMAPQPEGNRGMRAGDRREVRSTVCRGGGVSERNGLRRCIGDVGFLVDVQAVLPMFVPTLACPQA